MPELDSHDEELGATLQARRPRPSPRFASGLRERLVVLESTARRPEHLWTLVSAYAGSGVLLLVLAALGAAGAGPFGS